MHISRESPAQTERRLRRVIAAAEVVFLPGDYAFTEFPAAQFPAHLADRALALVRDDTVWCALHPATGGEAERFAVFRFHFPAQMDNSGFVGWLASHLKNRLGTGVMVVCGQNSAHGGIFDYWGVPVALRIEVEREIALLRGASV
ncbi:MAG: hypothetical protein HYV95_14600 [Opitutae bacterium]|nr:hypothetical protein [Opitutae bacterium]